MRHEPDPRRSGRLWWKLALVLLLLVAAVGVVGPLLAAPFVREKVVAGLDGSLQARSSLEELRFDLAGRVRVGGFALEDLEGRPFLRLGELDLDAGVLDAVRGRWSVRVRAADFELHLRQNEEGLWNFESIAGESSDDSASSETGDAPTLSAQVELARGRVVVHGREGQTAFEDVELQFELADLREPASFRMRTRVEGPGGTGGNVTAEGEFVGSSDGKLGPGSVTANAAVVIGELALAAFAPLAELTSPVTQLSGAAQGRLDVSLESGMQLNGEWDLVVEELRVATAGDGYGPVQAKRVAVQGNAHSGPAVLEWTTNVVAEELDVAAPESGGPAVREPKLELGLRASVATETFELTLHDLSIRSRLARGQVTGTIGGLATMADEEPRLVFENLKGEVVYIPDQVGVLLGPMLPGELSGSEEERMLFHLSGTAHGLDPMSLLAAAEGGASLGLGTFTAQGIVASGGVDVEVRDGLATLRGDLGANGGALALEGVLGLGAKASEGARASFRMKDVGATSGLAPLLELLHPAFGGLAGRLESNRISGLFSCDLELRYDAPLSSARLGSEGAGLDLTAISGSGTFSMDQALLGGSELLGKLFSDLGTGRSKELKVKPIDFRIDAGRLRYQKPWIWNLSGSETEFRGSIGLDRTLDMTWDVPVTQELIAKNDFLKSLAGQTLSIPLKGTVQSPKLEWKGVLEEVAASALKRELEDELGLDDLKRQLGGALGQPATGGSAQGESVESLFTEANRLWNEGRKKEAAVIYGRIRSEFKLTPIYLLNRGLIKQRAAHEE